MIIFVIIVIGTNQLLTSANPSCFVIDDQDVPISLPPHPELPGDPPIVSQPRSILPGYVYEYDDSLDLSPFEPDQRFCHSPQWPYAPDSSVYNHFYDYVLPELELALEMRPRSFSPPPKTQTQVLLPPSHLVPADLDTAIFRSPKSSPTWTPDSQPSNFDQSSSPYLDLRSKQTRIDEDVTRILQIVKDVTAEDSGRFQKVSPSSSPVASTIPRKHSTQEGDAFYDAASEIESVATESDSTRAESNPNNSKDAAPNVDIQNVVAVLESSAKAERNMTIWPEAEILATRVNNSTESDVIGRVRRQSQSPPKAVLHSDDRANVVPGHGKVRFQIPHPAEAHVYTDQSDGSDSEEPVSPNRLDDDESDDSYLSSPDSSSSPTNPPVYSTIPSSPRGPVLNRSVGGRTQENLLSASTTEKQAQPKSRKLLIKFKDAILGKKQRNRL